MRAGRCRPLERRSGPASISPGEGGAPGSDLYLTHTRGWKNHLHHKATPREGRQRAEPAQAARQRTPAPPRGPARRPHRAGRRPGAALAPGPGCTEGARSRAALPTRTAGQETPGGCEAVPSVPEKVMGHVNPSPIFKSRYDP